MNNQPSPFLTPAEMAYIEGTNEINTELGLMLDSNYGSENRTEDKEMATLKQAAEAYEQPRTLNIADLDKVSVEVEVKTETHQNNNGEDFSMDVIEVEGKKYRVPASVLDGMKAILNKRPNTKHIQVIKSGQGMNTKYQVLPYEEVKTETVV